MADTILVNVKPYETRVCLIDKDIIQSIKIERSKERGIVGNIYLGKVQRVLPGMQAAFIDIGEEKAGFLYVGDIVPTSHDGDEIFSHAPSSIHIEDKNNDEATYQGPKTVDLMLSQESVPLTESMDMQFPEPNWIKPSSQYKIEDLLSQGDSVLVQVAKDPIGTKGPRLTCNISFPGRYVVFLPSRTHIGISRRIVDPVERERLKNLLIELCPKENGCVARTVAENVSKENLHDDINFLHSVWNMVQEKASKIKSPALVQAELDLVLKTVRDNLKEITTKFIIDDEKKYLEVLDFVNLRASSFKDKLRLHQGPSALFDLYQIDNEINRAMSRKVWLKSGGYLIIDQAEALSVIDVNTGKFVGKHNLEDTIVKTNLEAVKEIAYQLRLRNIGGIIIVDFIDMEEDAHRSRILEALNLAVDDDPERCKVVRMSELGLVEMTRRRTRESIAHQLTEQCWYCEGRGRLRSKQSIVYDIFREIELYANRLKEPYIVVHANPEVVDLILSTDANYMKGLEEKLKREIIVKPRGSFHHEQFDIHAISDSKAIN